MILSDGDIQSRLKLGSLVVRPSLPELLQPASIDLRLGNDFCVMDPSGRPLDPERLSSEFQHSAYIPNGRSLHLSPGEFFLGETLECIEVPDDLVGILSGKSTLGRLGLTVHSTAGFIDPGFKGSITLELSTDGSRPVTLRPGMRIAQISFQTLSSRAQRPYGSPGLGSHYQSQQGATPPHSLDTQQQEAP